MKRIQFLFFVLFVSAIAKAQTIKGKLADPAENKPLAGAGDRKKILKKRCCRIETIRI